MENFKSQICLMLFFIWVALIVNSVSVIDSVSTVWHYTCSLTVCLLNSMSSVWWQICWQYICCYRMSFVWHCICFMVVEVCPQWRVYSMKVRLLFKRVSFVIVTDVWQCLVFDKMSVLWEYVSMTVCRFIVCLLFNNIWDSASVCRCACYLTV